MRKALRLQLEIPQRGPAGPQPVSVRVARAAARPAALVLVMLLLLVLLFLLMLLVPVPGHPATTVSLSSAVTSQLQKRII